jgi:large subunit ribosomal protein L28
MSRKCILCEKGPSAGRNVSHSRRHTIRRFLPNVQKKSFLFKGEKHSGYICTKCMKRYKAEIVYQ